MMGTNLLFTLLMILDFSPCPCGYCQCLHLHQFGLSFHVRLARHDLSELLFQAAKNNKEESDDIFVFFLQTMKTEAELRAGIQKLESAGDNEQLTASREQLTGILVKKETLVKKISYIEADIAQKEKAVKKKK